ncbi:MAG: hypothetical protein ABI461_19795, partial [Polyangiaceae bacterium]
MLISRSWLAAASFGALGAVTACAKPPVITPVVSQAEWTDSRNALAELRRRVPRRPFVEIVHVSMREPKTG